MRYLIPILFLFTACRYDRPQEIVIHSSMYGTVVPFAVHRLHEAFGCELLRIVPQRESDWEGLWPDRGRVTVQRLLDEEIPEKLDPPEEAFGWLAYPLPKRNRGRIFFFESRGFPTELEVMHELLHAVLIREGKHYGKEGLLGSEKVTTEVNAELRRDVKARCLQ